MMDSAKRILLGVAYSPQVVASARALVLYALPVLITLFVGWANTITDPRFYGIALACVPFVRAIGEGLLDQIQKSTQNDSRPLPPAGASPGADGNAVRGID